MNQLEGMNKKAYFVSDLHLGAQNIHAIPDRELFFCNFLQKLASRASDLFILGDLFEFWMEYSHFIPKSYFKVLAGLYELSRQGVKIHYLSGNHDFNLGHFFQKIGVHTHHHPFTITLQGKSLFLLHGDGMAKSDWKYRFVKKILVHPISNWCFKLIHPDWGMKLAKLVGKASRGRLAYCQYNEYQDRGVQLLKKDVDIVMHGHTHSAFIKKVNGGIYVNAGNWFESMHYVEMDEGNCTIRTYSPETGLQSH